jgi:hypothetical protein
LKRSAKDWTDVFRVGKLVFEFSGNFMVKCALCSWETILHGCKSSCSCQRGVMKNPLLVSCLGAIALVLASCAPSTPESRIYERHRVFETFSKEHQELVRQGEIAKGMSPDAVSIAWGSPSGVVEGLRDGKRMERWDYTGTRPVVTNNFFGGYNTGYYGRYRYSGVGGGFGPQVTYVPYRKSSVWFVGGRVNEWERVR